MSVRLVDIVIKHSPNIGIRNTTQEYKPVFIFIRGGRVSDCNRRACEGGKTGNID